MKRDAPGYSGRLPFVKSAKSPSAPTFAHSSSARVPTCCPASPHVFSTFRWYKHSSWIGSQSRASSHRELRYGARICSHAWRCCPSGALMAQKHFSGYSIKFCLPQWCTPFFRVQPNTQWMGSSAGSTTAISATSSDRRRWPKRLRSSSNATDPAPRLHVYSRCEPSTDHPPGLSSGACPLLLGCTSGLRVTTGSPATLVLIGSNVV